MVLIVKVFPGFVVPMPTLPTKVLYPAFVKAFAAFRYAMFAVSVRFVEAIVMFAVPLND